MMLRTLSLLFGLAFLAIGILGFIPEVAVGGLLFGIFKLNTAHNLLHVLTGATAFWCGAKSVKASGLFFRLFGIFYSLLAVLGLYYFKSSILGVISNHLPDTLLHLFLAGIFLYLGFFFKK